MVTPARFEKSYGDVFKGSQEWQDIKGASGDLYTWDKASTYIQEPPFFTEFGLSETTPAHFATRDGGEQLVLEHTPWLVGDSDELDPGELRPCYGEAIRAKGALLVSESGLFNRDDLDRVQNAGADAVLVGESLMRQSDVTAALEALIGG